MKQRMRKALVAVVGLALAAFTPFAASAGAEVYEMTPYASMDLDLSQPMPNGTFLIQSPQLAFPGYKLTDLAGKGMFGCMSGAYVSVKGLGPVVNLKFYPSAEEPTKALCSLNYVNSETKAVVIQLTEGEDGVYAEAAPNAGVQTPARYLNKGAITMLCAEFDASTGAISYKQNKGTLATSDAGAGYGARGLTLERFLNKTAPVLAFEGATLEDIEGYSFSGYSCGQYITVGQATPMLGYNAKLVGEGADQKLRVEMQLKEGTNVKCVVVEFTGGEDGVYVKPVAARYQAGADCGFKFVNDNGTYNGSAGTVVTDFSGAGYGVFRLKAVQPPQNVAVWTGAAGDGDIWNEMNWKDEIPPTDETTVQMGGDIYMNWPEEEVTLDCAAIEFTSAVKLTDNCDWSGMPVTPDMRGFPLDLNGKQLTVTKMMDGTVKDSTTEDPGQLIVSVAEDGETENTTMALTGNAQLVKEGAGTYIHSIATTIGLARVDAGTFKLGTNKIATQITVGDGATLDINGKVETEFKLYLEDGATLTNTGAAGGNTVKQITGGIELEADATAYITAPSKVYRLLGHNYTQTTVTLNGGTLVHSGSGGFEYVNTKFVGPGKVKVESDAIYVGYKGFACTDDFTLELDEDGKLSCSAAITLPTLIGSGNLTGNPATVTKLCGPVNFVGSTATARVILGDGATNDLSGVEGTYDASRFTFDATANIKIGDREIEAGEKLISWTTQPTGTTFTFTDYEGELEPVANEDGLYASDGAGSKVVDKGYWTNAAGDGDPLNPANWACTNITGKVVAGGIPTNDTAKVVLSGPLTQNLDWTKLGAFAFAADSTVDLNGFALTVGGFRNSTTGVVITNGAETPAQFIVNVAEETTAENTSVAIAGNVQLVKIGEGTFINNKTQTYTGGTLVSAGTLKLPAVSSGRYYLGPDGSSITVEEGATFNMNGCYDLNVYSIILAGGTLKTERVDQTTYGTGSLGVVTLTADSYFDLAAHVLFYRGLGAAVDMGGHTLKVTSTRASGAALCSFNGPAEIKNGVFELCSGQLNLRAANVDLSTASLVIAEGSVWLHTKGAYTVTDLDMQNTGSAGQIYVTNVFCSANGQFDAVQLKDGATLDLSVNTNTLAAADKLTFAAGAIAVDVTGREVTNGMQLVSWTTQPGETTTFAFKGYEGELEPVAEEDGLYARQLGVAKIGDTYYATLAAANAAAEDGDTIELVKSAEGDGIFVSKNVTFDFGGNTYTLTGMPVGSTGYETQGFHIEAANCTLTNGTINCSAENRDKTWAEGATVAEKGIAMLVQNYASLTVADMTLDGTNLAKAYYGKGEARKPGANYTLSNCSGTTTIAGTTISARDGESFAFDSDKTAAVTLASGTVSGKIEVCASLTIDGGTINGPTNGEEYDGKAVITVAGGTLNFVGGTLTATGSGDSGMYGVYVKNGGTATFGTTQAGPTITSWFAAIGANNTTAPCTITVNGGTYTQKADGKGQWWHYFCAAVYAPAEGTYTINGGTFTGALYCLASPYANVQQTIAFEGGTFNQPLYVAEEQGAGTGTRTITKADGVTITPPEGYEWKDGVLVKAGPTPAPGSDVQVDPVPGYDNTYIVTPTGESKDLLIQGVKSGDTLVVDGQAVDSLGVNDAAGVTVKVTTPNAETPTSPYDITAACKGWDGTKFSAELDPEAEVKIGEETIPVTPTAIEPEEGGTIAEGEVATKAIPGLTYKLMRGTELGEYETETASAQATTTTVTLKDGTTKPADKAFYVIEVTK